MPILFTRAGAPCKRRLTKSWARGLHFILLITAALPVAAQTPSDPLGRGTPRGTITTFVWAVHRDDFVSAARHMQIPPSQRSNTEALARDLNDLMNRYFKHTVASISDSPSGVLNDGLTVDRERVGPLTIAGKDFDIMLVRVEDPQGGPVWLFASETLAQVPAMHHSLEKSWVERMMPEPLVNNSLFGISLAHWIVWSASMAIPLLLFGLLARILAVLANRTIDDPVRRALFKSWYDGLHWPIIVALALGFHLASMPFLGVSLSFRLIHARFGLVTAVVVLAWLARRLLTLTFDRARNLMRRRDQTGTKSLMLLGERLFKVLIVVVAIFSILNIAGVDTKTALAGVGIGGIAIALGAQKTVENLLGGVFLLSDKALAVGDTCSISNRVGTIEDITLRSVRLRTPEQTLLSIPAGILAQANIENFATRGKILLQTTLRLRYGTSAEQLRLVLDRIYQLLRENSSFEADTARIRLVDFGVRSIDLELFAYVLTADMLKFLAVREELLLQIAALVESSGSGFAQPTQFVYLESTPSTDGRDRDSDGRKEVPLSLAPIDTPAGDTVRSATLAAPSPKENP